MALSMATKLASRSLPASRPSWRSFSLTYRIYPFVVAVALVSTLVTQAWCLPIFSAPTHLDFGVSSSDMALNSMAVADLNGDGALDVVFGSSNLFEAPSFRLRWFRNMGGGVFGLPILISNRLGNYVTVLATDLDSDGDNDIVATGSTNFFISLFRNSGMGNFSASNITTTSPGGIVAFFASDLDGDGDLDLLYSSYVRTGWYRNNGTGGFGPSNTIANTASACVSTADMNQDGHVDVLFSDMDVDRIVWFRNNGSGSLAGPFIVKDFSLPAVTSPADIDNDGKVDVLYALYFESIVGWIRNQGGGNFSLPAIILSFTARGAEWVSAGDLDSDGLLDVMSASRSDSTISWYQNLGKGQMSAEIIIDFERTSAAFVAPADINGDGRLDVIAMTTTIFDNIVWYRNLPGYAIGSKTQETCPDAGTVGESCRVQMITYDSAGASGALASMEVTVIGPESVAASVERTSLGYNLTFVPPVVGEYALQVFIDERYIFSCTLIAGPFVCAAGSRAELNAEPPDCFPCDADSFQDIDGYQGSTCTPCRNQTSTHRRRGSTSALNCTCIAKFYSVGPGEPCLGCPTGAVCAGDGARPVPISGYARVGSTETFALCPRPQSCLGAAGCARGYRGPFCKDCESAYYADASGECRSCPGGSKGLLATYILLVIGLSIAASLVVLFSMTRVGGESKNNVLLSSVYRARKFPPSVPLIISAFQIVGILAVANLSWPASAQGALNTFNLFSLDINLFASECSLSSFSGKYAMAVFTPAVFAILVVAEILLLRVGRRFIGALADLAEVGVGAQCLAVFFLVGPLGYLPVSRSTLALFDCTKLADGRYYLDADMSMQCFGPRWWALLPIGLFGCVAYVIAVPGAIAVTMYLNRASLFTDVSVIRSFGSVYKLFRRPYTFMPLALLGKKLAIAIWSLFFSRLQAIQFAGLLFILLGSGCVQMFVQPYYFPIYDRMEMVFSVLLSGLLVCGMMTFSSKVNNNEQVDKDRFTVLVAVVVIALVVALLGLSVYFVYRDIRGIRSDFRTSRDGQTPDNSRGSHAKRMRAFADSNLRDLDDPAGFVRSLIDGLEEHRGADRGARRTSASAADLDQGIELK
eukprot:c20411_g2_i2.p1 GENE.c20411_g2_i2~~c20411_g2_i2.p1  ORF type:complete len:1098 (+),score=164.30 c20411_g2_i2:64-3357(+)